jgi:cytochrome c biogenesis protein CcmG/thiol:disulfide interchange protein DsbE
MNMSPKRRLTLLLALPLAGFAILLAVFGLGLGHDPSLLPSVLINKPLPGFQAPRLDDPQQTVSAGDLQGEISLLNIWATWCPTCRAEHEFLNTLKQQGIAIYGVNYKDERDKALEWLATLGDPYRLNIDDSAGQLGIDLGVYGAPETYLLDADGVIRYRHVGALDGEIWQREFVPRIATLRTENNS